MSTTIHLNKSSGVATLTVDGPRNKNAITAPAARDIIEACEQIDRDSAIGGVILTGANGTFCSGADRALLKAAEEDPARDDLYEHLGLAYESFMRVGALAVPVVAAARGASVGAGVNLLLSADLRIIAEDARIIAGFARIGLHPGGGNFKLVTRLGGREAASAISLFGEEISGRRSAEIGLCWEAVPDGEVLARATQLAERVAEDPELSRRAVRSFRLSSDMGPDWRVAMEMERSSQMWSLRRKHAASVAVEV